MIEPGKIEFHCGEWYFGWIWDHDNSFFYPFNYLPRGNRYLGHRKLYFDGPIHCFGFWFFNTSWRW